MNKAFNLAVAILSRILFTVHGILTVWRVVAVKRNPIFWLLLAGVALLMVEMVATLKFTHKGEWKWFSPMVFLYLSTVIPSIWFLEIDMLQSKQPANASGSNATGLSSGLPIPEDLIHLNPDSWTAGLEQTMLIILVVGRWLMPKGDMSRDQLSQLLLVYVGLGADILDIFDTFKEPAVETNYNIVIIGLTLFTWAIIQFTLVLTQTTPFHTDIKTKSDESVVAHARKVAGSCCLSCCSSEIWSLLVTVGMQDGPFLIYRLYLMIHENVLNQLMIFFTCKNILTVMIEIYRIAAIHSEANKKEPDTLNASVTTETGEHAKYSKETE
ncbi:transmembrane protein 26-like [Erpetoichthys calabaricus]|uniref:transmembrane protein 26-like n=1 Tax=Erpetoichthys calabaricus TaxID=27687 RepID=UPI00109F24F5|nr:transmembrane protein 26-like [Erpetoichthys calabaricus]